MTHGSRRIRMLVAFTALLVFDRAVFAAATRTVQVGPGEIHIFVDAVSNSSISNIFVGDSIEWVWSSTITPHSTTSGTCSGIVCTADGTWNSMEHYAPNNFTQMFSVAGTYHYFCMVHLYMMQGTVIVSEPGPAPTVTAIAPTSGPADAATAVSVTGTNFVLGASLAIGGLDATGVSVPDAGTIDAMTPFPLMPGTLNDVTVTNLDAGTATLPKGWFADFTDVPHSNQFHNAVEKIFRNGITAGCGDGTMYCPSQAVSRAEMAIFLLKGEHGSAYTPPDCTGIFADVACTPTPDFAVNWIEQLHNETITAGCHGGVDYCPNDPVTRAQMAVFLLKAEHGSLYTPPACAGVFTDVACTPTPDFGVNWIEALYGETVTAGCGVAPLKYCPDDSVPRDQMAVFLSKTFLTP